MPPARVSGRQISLQRCVTGWSYPVQEAWLARLCQVRALEPVQVLVQLGRVPEPEQVQRVPVPSVQSLCWLMGRWWATVMSSTR